MPRRSNRRITLWNDRQFVATIATRAKGKSLNSDDDDLPSRAGKKNTQQYEQQQQSSNHGEVEEDAQAHGQMAARQNPRPQKLHVREFKGQSETYVALEERVAQCTSCMTRFTYPADASRKHNAHHPGCSLFDRSIPWCDTDRWYDMVSLTSVTRLLSLRHAHLTCCVTYKKIWCVFTVDKANERGPVERTS